MDILFPLAVLAGVIYVIKVALRCTTVFDYEEAIKYVKGQCEGRLGPGQYWHMPFFVTIQKVDRRPRFVSITGQEVLSSDAVTLKVSLAAHYEVADTTVAINNVQDYQEALYLKLQLALRQIIGQSPIDDVLAKRDEISDQLLQATEAQARELGLRLISVSIKDIMFPGRLKEVFAQVVNARHEGLAALEKARGETAALRNLANAAKMIQSNPNLLPLRLVQAIGGSTGNTVVMPPLAPGVAPGATPAPGYSFGVVPGIAAAAVPPADPSAARTTAKKKTTRRRAKKDS